MPQGKEAFEREARKLKEVNEVFDQVEGRGESSPGVRPSVKEQQEVSYQSGNRNPRPPDTFAFCL
jgi:hypothetical protein